MNYAQEQRLRFIHFLLTHYGNVGRAEIEDFFGVGGATSTRDFALYNSIFPGNAVMNPASKRWVKTETFPNAFQPMRKPGDGK